MRYFLTVLMWILFLPLEVHSWGFFAHRKINRHAVYSLPPEMIGFFKYHIHYITENAVNPDRRRYAVLGEAEKHYLDADAYGDSAVYKLPRYWHQALEQYSEEELRQKGIGPWNVYRTHLSLTEAFKKRDIKAILRLSADLGHYIGDMNVPLHTTKNYNGQLTNQYGIHGFWESRIPELLAEEYDFLVGKAEYLEGPQYAIWGALTLAHVALDSVLQFEKVVSDRFSEDKKYSYEERNGINTRVYSKEFTKAYHDLLDGQVERQMKRAIKLTADFWYTAWINAGQPDLNGLVNIELDLPKEKFEKSKPFDVREHEGMGYSSTHSPLRKAFLSALWRPGL
jgi:hypothetical protein